MRTLALVQGDLVLSGGSYLTYTGSDKLRQDLDLALTEDYGADPFHPYWGSILDRYIGLPLTPSLRQAVVTEVQRVLKNYILVQQSNITADATYNDRSQYSTSDVIQAVEAIDVQVTFDRIQVSLTLRAVSGQLTTVVRQVLG